MRLRFNRRRGSRCGWTVTGLGDDILRGENGRDVLDARGGTDLLLGGAGDAAR